MSNVENKQYQVLARKYRPQKFSELVGQDALVQTLSNEIKTNKIHHAFILTGIRGIGKTTTARIIAKSLNCSKSNTATIDPCCECEHCKAIANSSDPDVIEFDAASHTGVDDIRKIVDFTTFAPISSRYKIFIIDEVHMLSNSAFNALLKTLEEPPTYVKFIFATTEFKKIPITIVSRCQKFDLRRLSFEEIKQHLKNICEKENYQAEDNALSIISQFAEGSVRDALSLLDRALSHNNYEKLLTEKSVSEIFGLTSKKDIYDLFIDMLEGNVEKSLIQFEKIYSYSLDVSSLMTDLLDINHNMILAKTLKNFFEITHISSDQIEVIKNTIEKVDLSSLIRIWKMLLNSQKNFKTNFDMKKIMDVIIINICYSSKMPSIEEIIKNDDDKLLSKMDFDNNKKKDEDEQMYLNMFEGSTIIN